MHSRYRLLAGGIVLIAGIAILGTIFIAFARSPGIVSGNPSTWPPPTQELSGVIPPATLPAYLSPTAPPFPSVIPTPHYAGIADSVRGIVPRTKTTDPRTPTFTDQDVRDYYAQRGVTATTSGATLLSVTFQTVGQTNQAFGGPSLNFPGDMLVCVALVKGDFSRQSKIPNGYGPVVTLTQEFTVFDGHSGNVLMVRTAP